MPWPGQWGEVGRRLPRLSSPKQAKTQRPFPELESAFLLVQTFFILSCHLQLHYTFLFTFIAFLPCSSKSSFSGTEKTAKNFNFTVLKKVLRSFKNTEIKYFKTILKVLPFPFHVELIVEFAQNQKYFWSSLTASICCIYCGKKPLLISPLALIMHGMTGGFLKWKYTSPSESTGRNGIV